MNLNKKKYVSPKLEYYMPLAYSSNSLEIKLSQPEKLPTTAKLIVSRNDFLFEVTTLNIL